MTTGQWDFSDLKAVIFNCTLKKSPEVSNTEGLIKITQGIFNKHGVKNELIRSIDHDIATGVWPDMTEHGWATDEWPELFKKVMAADILIIAGPIWLGDNSSETKKIIERLYACSSILNDKGQYAFYGRVGGCLITGNEDGIKHCSMDILYAMQHVGYMIPPQADSGWIGEAGPGPSYGDTEWEGKPIGDGKTPLGYNNEFTNRNTTFMCWNLMHTATMLNAIGGIPAKGNTTSDWKNVSHASSENPEYH